MGSPGGRGLFVGGAYLWAEPLLRGAPTANPIGDAWNHTAALSQGVGVNLHNNNNNNNLFPAISHGPLFDVCFHVR